jgi:hypothetical protein
VIDAKASPKVKLAHKIQVGLYVLFLEAIIEHEKLEGVTVSDVGAIWLR